MVRDIMTAYGEIGLDRVDIRAIPCMTVDLRAETGGRAQDTSVLLQPPHPFELSVLKPSPNEPPIGEIILWLRDREVHLVGKLTGRPVFEITPDILIAAKDDPAYLLRIRQWLGLAA